MSDASASAPHRPKLWLALLLSVFFPGVGHMYAGALRRGLVAVSIMLAVNLAYFVLAAQAFWLLLAVLVVGVLAWLVILYDVFRLCRRAPVQPLRPFQRWYVYVAVAAAYVAANAVFDFGARATI